MKVKMKVFLFLILLTSISFLCSAQLAMSIKMNRRNYLQYETIYAKIKIRNNSGHAIVFGDNKRLQGKLLFKIMGGRIFQLKLFPKEYILWRELLSKQVSSRNLSFP